VDDEPSIIKALQRLFRKQGGEILTAASGPEALEMIGVLDKPLSLILSDQRMPQMTGAEFLEKSRQRFSQAMPILLTGYSDFAAITDAGNRGEIYRYLSKP
jgi:CheY-like chemotaxis protein